MAQSIERVDHTIPNQEAVFAFGPEMKPVLEVDPGEVVTFETHNCFSGQIQTEGAFGHATVPRGEGKSAVQGGRLRVPRPRGVG